METTSLCVKCANENEHEVDDGGEAIVDCESCGTGYDVRTYEVRSFGARPDPKSGVTAYTIGVNSPDGENSAVKFDSKEDVVVDTGDSISVSYYAGLPKYLLDRSTRRFWDLQKGMGCGAVLLVILVASFAIAAPLVLFVATHHT